jgi:hypothetical protein
MNTEHGCSNGQELAIGWDRIEKHLVGLADLDELIDRLLNNRAEQPGPAPPIAKVLGSRRQEILERGLAPAPAEILDYLLQRRWRLSDGSKVPPTPGNTPASSSTVRNTLNSMSRFT